MAAPAAPHPWTTRGVAVVFVVWAAGVVLGEGLAQGAAIGALLLALALRPTLAADARAFVRATLALAAWQALSPGLALARHLTVAWPTSGRYGQVLDTAAPAAATALAALGPPWLALAWVLGVGWLGSVALGVYQHFVRWPFGQPFGVGSPVARVHEVFSVDGPERFAAGGFQFHRLRFAHGAIATLGPALSAAFGARARRLRLGAAGLGLALFFGLYFSYARAALAAGALILGLALLSAPGARPWLRRTIAGAVVGAVVLAVGLSSAWRERAVLAEQNLFEGGRHDALSVGLRLAELHPVFGVGFGNYKPAARALGEADPRFAINPALTSDAHNLWLTTWVETGVLGLALLAWQHLTLVLGLWRRHRLGSWPATGALLAWVGFQLLSLFHYLPYHSGVFLSFALVWGLGFAPVGDLENHSR